MSLSILKQRDHFNAANRLEFIVDEDADFDNLPGLDKCAVGSTAYSIASGAKKIINHSGEWVTMASSSGGGSGSCVYGMTDWSENGM